MISPSVARRHPLRFALTLVTTATLAACGGGSGDDGSSAVDDDDLSNGGVPVDALDMSGAGDAAGPLPGDIARYGALNLGDDGTRATELVAVFFELPESVSPAAFGGALDPDVADCSVVPAGGDIGLAAISAGFLPVPSGVPVSSLVSLDAGETLTLTSATAGTYAELQPGGSLGGNAFYEPVSMLPDGAVPEDLVLDVPGAAFPPFASAALAPVTPLEGFDDGPGDTVDADAEFSWTPGDDPGAKIRLATSTNAGFFADPGSVVSVFCTVPDTGSYAFDADTRAALGTDFEGAAVAASRVAIDTVATDDALLILVREGDSAQ